MQGHGNAKKNTNLNIFQHGFSKKNEFVTTVKEMTPTQLNKCLEKFYVSARKRYWRNYNKKSQLNSCNT